MYLTMWEVGGAATAAIAAAITWLQSSERCVHARPHHNRLVCVFTFCGYRAVLPLSVDARQQHKPVPCHHHPQEQKDEAAAKEMWASCSLSLEKLLPSFSNDAAAQEKVLARYDAQYLTA